MREDFNGPALAPYWMMVRNPRGDWLRLRDGALELTAQTVPLGGMGNPAFVVRRQQHMNAEVSTTVRFQPMGASDEAGIAAFQNDDYFYALSVGRDAGHVTLRLRRRAGSNDPQWGAVVATARFPGPLGTPVRLRITTDSRSYSFFYAGPRGPWRQLGQSQDGTILSTRTAGGFVGAVFGMFAVEALRAAPH
jgi:alpha-N-arabinofuranosidase